MQSEIIKHTHLFQIAIEISPLQASLLTGCVYKFVLTVLWFSVMGYVLQFGQMVHKRVHCFIIIPVLFISHKMAALTVVFSWLKLHLFLFLTG